MIVLKILFYFLALFAISGAFWPFLRTKVWWVRIYDFPRLQLTTLLAFGLVCMPWIIQFDDPFDFMLLVFILVALAVNFYKIFPYIPGTKKTVPSSAGTGETKTMFIGNVKMENTQYAQWSQLVLDCDADMVFLVETCQKWHDGMEAVREAYPHKVEVPLEQHNGMLFYSKIPIKSYEVRYLIRPIIPSLRIVLEDDTVIYGLHPRPPRPQNNADERDNELMAVANEIQHIKAPVIVAGDLNDVGWSRSTRHFLKRSQLRDPRRGRGLFNSFHAQYWCVRWPLDHLFVTDHYSVVRMSRLKPYGSDHFPLSVCIERTKDDDI